MRKPPRNSDGSIRQTNKPKRLTNRSIIARWIETVALHLKRLGMSYQAIADHIMAVARGQQKAMVPVPEDANFGEAYSISPQAVHRAFRRAIVRLPNAEAAELRKLDSERLEDMLLSLQTGIRQGDPRCVEVAVRVLVHKAEINGYKAPARVEMSGSRVDVMVQQAAQSEAQTLSELSRLTVEELREYRRLEAKARGTLDVTGNETATASVEEAAQDKSSRGDEE
jgi:phage FluMu protein gp41